jgi:hypothetical protein
MLIVLGLLTAVAAFFGLLYAVPRSRNNRELERNRAALESLGDCYPIIMPVCDRPEYLKQVLDNLQKSIGIEETVLVFSQDERNEEVIALIDAVPLRKIHFKHTQPFFAFFARIGLITRIHCTASNIFFAIDSVMKTAKPKGVIVLEDDLVPSINFYRYFQWCFDQVLLDPEVGRNVLTCGAYNIFSKGNIPLSERHSIYLGADYFNPWGWAISRERWDDIRGDWSFTSWDGNMDHRIQRLKGLVNYYPFLSHVDCIGNHGVNMSRSADCNFYRTHLDPEPIDFAGAKVRIAEDLPAEYRAEQDKYERVLDPDNKSEWDRKIVPVVWDKVKAQLSGERIVAMKRILPWL